ncbi:MAG: trypsin-like peptidase domain-containing protein [Candidatus Cloacimonetes bacterium]|nr:trypsin-like peptidase domain-containing protein [Candidatus Cloacimonadota bacterium]
MSRKRFAVSALLLLCAVTGLLVSCERQQQQALPLMPYSRENAITEAVRLAAPSVVSVNVIKTEVVNARINPRYSPYFGFFDAPHIRNVQAIGSGLIIDERGFVVTNAHVVEGATQITVILADNRQYNTRIIGMDSIQDIAVLKIEGHELPVARLGASSDLIIGEAAIAVGNPYAFLIKDSQPSVSVGVISAINRNFAQNLNDKVFKKMIQTDAAINAGNSGGPLLNINGDVIGINTFIFSETGESVGIGFAIPIDRVKKIAHELILYGQMRQRHFGFRMTNLNQLLANQFQLPNLNGVLVVDVENDGPADNAGLEVGDVILKFNGTFIVESDDLRLAILDVAVGDNILLEVIRNGHPLQVQMRVEEL